MFTGKLEVKPNVSGVFTADGVYSAEHSSSTVDITLEFANDAEVAALFSQFVIKPKQPQGPITAEEVAGRLHDERRK